MTFWSGAIRCPKCRSDMDQVTHEGIEVDRCRLCKGIWFDAGEIEALTDKQAAAAIDIGEIETGKQHDTLRDYECPRCGGAMGCIADARQPHITFETCQDCHGSFLDAGELSDLAHVSVGEFFKSLLPGRGSGGNG